VGRAGGVLRPAKPAQHDGTRGVVVAAVSMIAPLRGAFACEIADGGLEVAVRGRGP